MIVLMSRRVDRDTNVKRNLDVKDSIDRSHYCYDAWGASVMAAQQKLGIRSRHWLGCGAGCSGLFDDDGKDMKGLRSVSAGCD